MTQRYTFTINKWIDPQYINYLRKHYVESTKDTESYGDNCIFEVSDFLQSKLDAWTDVNSFHLSPVWIGTTKDLVKQVIKIYWSPVRWTRAITSQKKMAETGIGCQLLESWQNGIEYFTLSEYGGRSLADIYSYHPMPDSILDQKDLLLKKLRELGLKLKDDHHGNYVLDEQGQMKLVDYDAVYPLESEGLKYLDTFEDLEV